MASSDPIIDHVVEVIRRASADAWERKKRRRRRRRRAFRRFVRTAAELVFATIVVIVGMVATGRLFGPTGTEGLLATPLILLVVWALILFRGRPAAELPKAAANGDVEQLPARTEDWLEAQRRSLPMAAQRKIDSIAQRLEALTPQVRQLPADSAAAGEVRRLLAEELPELVRGYQKVPAALKREALPGGQSPDRQLLAGLDTIEEEIGRMHERLAADDMRALATQQRYLEMKYKRDNKL